MTTTTTTTPDPRPSWTLTPEEIAERTRSSEVLASRTRTLSRDLRTALRILDGSIKDLRVVSSGPAPAWTDFSEVFLSSGDLPALHGVREVATWAGAAYHELGHVVFSPRPGSRLFQLLGGLREVRPGVFQTLNLVEDQRQELAMVSRFSPLRGYFSSLVVSLILGRPGGAEDSWPLVCGRTYLPETARRESRDAWTSQYGEASARRVASLVGKFQTLTDPAERDAETASEIVRELDEVLHEALSSSPSGCGSPDENRTGPSADTPPPPPGETASEADEDLRGDEDETPESGETSDGDEDGETSDGDEDSGESSGAGEGDREAPTDEETREEAVREALSEALSEVLSSEDVAEELRDLTEAMDLGSGTSEREREEVRNLASPSAEALSARESLDETLRDLRAAAEAEWILGTDSGRLNVSRWASPGLPDPSSLFDRFSPDSLDDVSVEAVVLVDLSGSMGQYEGPLSEAVWSIHHAAHAAEARLSVLGFSSGPAREIVGPDEVPGERVPVLRASGGTLPTDALRAAWDIFRASDATHRLLVTLSDGDWSRASEGEGLVRGMREDGVSTSAVLFRGGLGGDPSSFSRHSHGAERFVVSESLSDFAALVAEAVRDAMREGLLR